MNKILKSFILAATLIVPALIPDAAQAVLFSLKTVPVEEPLDLADYVTDRNAAIQLGKALFWDMQVGSDGVQACGTCHFHAGADTRTQNQLNPGTLGGDTLFGNNYLGLPSPASLGAPQDFKPNAKLTEGHFPFHKVTNKEISADPADPFFNPADLVSDTNDVVSSMGVERRQFVDIVPGNPVDLSAPQSDPVFQLAGQNIRRVEPRNTASVVNAVFNFSNFWDGRANNIFNGRNPFGPADPRGHALVDVNGNLGEQPVRLRQSSLASQAVGPPLSDFEMSWQGRTFPKVGKKMLSLRPLAQQKVHPQDSVLAPLADTVAGTGLTTTYAEMIKKAFPPMFWKNTSSHVLFLPDGSVQFQPGPPQNTNEYTQMEANFSLFFGLAIQLYEATLVADNSRLDRFLENSGSLTAQEQRGMAIFTGAGGCAACHAGGELTDNTLTLIQGADPITGFPQPLDQNPLGANDFMSLFTGSGLYDQGFHNIGVRPGGAADPAAPEYLAVNEDLSRGGNTDLPALLENFPLGFGRLGMRNIGFEGPSLPLFLSAYVPPLPFGFRPIDTFPYPGRVSNFGAFKTPGLRNVELTGPYMHNGGFATISQVVDFYVRGGDFPHTNAMDFDIGVLPIGFLIGSEPRKKDLIAFLLTMTDERVKQEAAPFDHPEIFVPVDGLAPVTPGTRDGLLASPTMFKQIPAVGAGGLAAELLPPLGTFMGLDPYYSGVNLAPPVPANDTGSTVQSSVVAIDVTANDANCNTVTPCTVTLASPPASGTAIANLPANGQVEYTPAYGFAGTDSFSYTATNAGGTSATAATVIVSVAPNPATDVVTINGATLQNGNLAVTGTVSAQNNAYAASVGVFAGACPGTSLGTAPVGNLGGWSFAAGVASPVSTVCVVSANGGIAQASVQTGTASAPVITSAPTLTATQGKSYAYKVTASDVDGGPLAFSLDQAPAGMTVKSSSAYVAWIGWWPTDTQTGMQDVTVRVTDPTGLFTTQSFRVDVAYMNGRPLVANDAYTMIKGGTLNVAAPGVLANDTDPDGGDTLTTTNFSVPKVGAVTGNANGSFSYTPPASYTGMDSFAYLARDNHGLASKTAGFVSIAVRANKAPVTVADTASTPPNTQQVIDVLGNDSDPDSVIDPSNRIDPATVFIPAGKQPDKGGTVSVNADGTITYTPQPGFTGTETFMYAVRDTYSTPGISRAASVSVNVAGETITFTRSQYTVAQSRLRVDGSISPVAGQTIVLDYIGSAGEVLGTAGSVVADVFGAWRLDAIVALPAGTTTIRATSPSDVVQSSTLTLL